MYVRYSISSHINMRSKVLNTAANLLFDEVRMPEHIVITHLTILSFQQGIPVVAAAGNNQAQLSDACFVSPASADKV